MGTRLLGRGGGHLRSGIFAFEVDLEKCPPPPIQFRLIEPREPESAGLLGGRLDGCRRRGRFLPKESRDFHGLLVLEHRDCPDSFPEPTR